MRVEVSPKSQSQKLSRTFPAWPFNTLFALFVSVSVWSIVSNIRVPYYVLGTVHYPEFTPHLFCFSLKSTQPAWPQPAVRKLLYLWACSILDTITSFTGMVIGTVETYRTLLWYDTGIHHLSYLSCLLFSCLFSSIHASVPRTYLQRY